MQYLSALRGKRSVEHTLQEERADQEALATAWNLRSLRHGDLVATVASNNMEWIHPNQYTTHGMAKLGWLCIGKSVANRTGIDGSTKHLGLVTSLAQSLHHVQDVWAQTKIDHMTTQYVVPVLRTASDATPTKLHLGSFRSLLMPYARYPWLNEDGQWKLLRYEEYLSARHEWQQTSRYSDDSDRRRWYPQQKLRYGVLEVLAQSWTVTYMESATRTLTGIRYLARPMILVNSTASCIYAAFQQECKHVGKESVANICEKSPFVFGTESPDAHSSNERKKQQAIEDAPDNLGLLHGRCMGHQAHRSVASREKVVIGNVHAIGVTTTQINNQNGMQAGLMELLENVDYRVGFPNPAWHAHSLQIIRRTHLRRAQFLEGDAQPHQPLDLNAFFHFCQFFRIEMCLPW